MRENAVIPVAPFGLRSSVDVQASRGGDGRGIHQVGLLLQAFVQNAFDGGVADQFGLGFRNVAAVAQGNMLQRAFAGLRQERAQAFRQHDVGVQLEVFLVRNRGNVHRVLDDAVL